MYEVAGERVSAKCDIKRHMGLLAIAGALSGTVTPFLEVLSRTNQHQNGYASFIFALKYDTLTSLCLQWSDHPFFIP